MRPRLAGLLVFLVMSLSPSVGADVLYRNQTFMAFGRGQEIGKRIHWATCDGERSQHVEPPFHLQRGDDCDQHLHDLGLVDLGADTYKVADQARFSGFIPGAREGDAVQVQNEDGKIVIAARDISIRLAVSRDPDLGDAFANDLSLAKGYQIAEQQDRAKFFLSDASGLLTEASTFDIFVDQQDAIEAASLLRELSSAESGLTSDAHDLLVKTAEYRSERRFKPEPPPGNPQPHGFFRWRASVGGVLNGTTFYMGTNGFPIRLDYVDEADRDALNTKISNSRVFGGSQALDNIRWSNVVFVGTHVIYSGGPLELDNVTFSHCTFEVTRGRNESNVLYYAMVEPSKALLNEARHGY